MLKFLGSSPTQAIHANPKVFALSVIVFKTYGVQMVLRHFGIFYA